ncbi:MAG: FecR domain-containing protein [Myxococcales bacterium]|nr:FecR domain-containing protein [Myxococcales bacterium]
MRWAARAALCGFGLGLLLGAPGPAAARSPAVAVVTDLVGAVHHQGEAKAAWTPAALDDGLALLDLIRTGARSKTEMRFVDRTVLGVGEKTRLRISMALFDVQQAPEAVRVALLAGQFDTAVAAAGRPLEVSAPSGDRQRIQPGRRARVRLVDGRLVVTELPPEVRFAAEPEVPHWFDDLDAVAPPGALAPGGRGAGDASPILPEASDPWVVPGAAPGSAPGPTGVDLILRPEGTP